MGHSLPSDSPTFHHSVGMVYLFVYLHCRELMTPQESSFCFIFRQLKNNSSLEWTKNCLSLANILGRGWPSRWLSLSHVPLSFSQSPRGLQEPPISASWFLIILYFLDCFRSWEGFYILTSVQTLSHVQLFAIPWTAARQASLSITNSQSLLRLMSIESVMPSISSTVVPFSSCPQSFPASGSFPMSWFFTSGGHSIGISASLSVLTMSIQDWFPLGWTGWISLQSKGLSSIFSNTTGPKHQFFGIQLFL